MPIIDGKEYECDCCHNIFDFLRDETWSREKANREYEKMFPTFPINDRAIVCDDCWIQIMRHN